MANATRKHIQRLIDTAKKYFSSIRILRELYDSESLLGLIDLEGTWQTYRIIITEVHRTDGAIRYSYYVLDKNNQLVQDFDNHRDKYAIKLKYGEKWQAHQDEEVPHQHNAQRQVTLTSFMTFDMFIAWLNSHFKRDGDDC